MQDGDDGTLLLNVNPWSAAQLFNIYDPSQRNRFTAIANDSVWHSSPNGKWHHLNNVNDEMNLKDILVAFPFKAAIFLCNDPHYCTEIWGPFAPWKKSEMNDECAWFISNTHGQYSKIVPAFIKIWRVHFFVKNMVHSQPLPKWLIYTP